MMLQLLYHLLINILLLQTCLGSGRVSIFLSEYNNPDGKLADARSCDDDDSSCDHKFTVCLDWSNGSLSDASTCGIGKYRTLAVENKDHIDFTQTSVGNNPKDVFFYEWQGHAILKVQVWDDNRGWKKDDLVEQLSINVSIDSRESSTGSQMKNFEIKNRTQLKFVMSVFCDNNWFGPNCDCNPTLANENHYKCDHSEGKICHNNWYDSNCDVFCQPTNDESGHYFCSSMGIKVCYKHWYGPECNIFCQPHDDEGGHYKCKQDGSRNCLLGWTGVDCNDNVNECQSGPCSDPGGHCVDKVNGYVCECQLGYTGHMCESDIDECASQPCHESATCQDLIGQFQCVFPPGFTGVESVNSWYNIPVVFGFMLLIISLLVVVAITVAVYAYRKAPCHRAAVEPPVEIVGNRSLDTDRASDNVYFRTPGDLAAEFSGHTNSPVRLQVPQVSYLQTSRHASESSIDTWSLQDTEEDDPNPRYVNVHHQGVSNYTDMAEFSECSGQEYVDNIQNEKEGSDDKCHSCSGGY